MVTKQTKKIFIIFLVCFILLFCLHGSCVTTNIKEAYNNCNPEMYYQTLNEMEKEVDDLYKSFTENKNNVEKTISYLRKKTKSNLDKAKKEVDASKNVQKQKASTSTIQKLHGHVDKKKEEEKMKASK